MLQQTRVEQGLPYYQRFIAAFPSIQHLADAPDQQVFKLWEGLGYYSRCRNLLATARHIAYDRAGVFPDKFEDILKLKGVGPYTAAAIASFAYNLPHAVLDGNVYRVLSRIHGVSIPTDSTEGKKLFATLAQQHLPPDEPAAYNQAIMDFGAVVCKPVPECSTCFFASECTAFKEGRQLALPVKEKQLQVSDRWFFYLVLQYGTEVAIRQRHEKDVWQSLYDFLLFETPATARWDTIAEEAEKVWSLDPASYDRIGTRYSVRQRLTHQLIRLEFECILLKERQELPGMEWVQVENLDQYAFPKSIKQFVDAVLKP
jgi:A/G-specific adenine glycosylase